MTTRWAYLSMFVLVVFVGTARAQVEGEGQATEVGVERARLEAAKHQAERRYLETVESCRHRFAVSACDTEARSQRRATLADLRRQEQALNNEERRRKASEAASRIEHRLATPAAPPTAVAARRPSSRPRLAEPGPAQASAGSASPVAAASRASSTSFEQRETAARQRRESVDREAQARARAAQEALDKAARKRESHELRMKQRDGRRASPLPDPAPGASAPGQGHRL